MNRENGSSPIRRRFAINLLENRANELLLLKRAADAEIGPGLWGVPAGRIEPGESPEQCSRRELKEEIGDDCTLDKVGAIGPFRDTLYGGVYEIFLFHYRWRTGTVTLNPEHTDYAWVKKEDYRNYAVVDGVDEDILYAGIWPREYLNADKLSNSG